MDQTTHTALNWMSYKQLHSILEAHGFAVNSGESEDDLREAVRTNMVDGTIPEHEVART